METRANYVLIGSFTLAVIAAAFGFVLWFQSLHTTKARAKATRLIMPPDSSEGNRSAASGFNPTMASLAKVISSSRRCD